MIASYKSRSAIVANWAAVVGFIFVLMPSLALAKYSGGAGEPHDPYLIADVNDLLVLGADVADYGKCFVMTEDVNMSGITAEQYNIIGNEDVPFRGLFDGNGHSITGFEHNSLGLKYIGVFGVVEGTDAAIKNLVIRGSSIHMNSNYGGLLAAHLKEGTVSNCRIVNGSVSGGQFTGLLVGENNGEMIGCDANGVVTCYGYCGGLVGINTGTISDCDASAVVTATSDTYFGTGGLVGKNDNGGVISDCKYSGHVVGGEGVGGLVGMNYDSTISDCVSEGQVCGKDSQVGGLVGSNLHGEISGCESRCDVICPGENIDDVGGLVGSNSGSTVKNCRSSGRVSAADHNSYGVAGLIGRNYESSVSECESDCEVSGGGYSVGGLIGASTRSSVFRCAARGDVTGVASNDAIGGLIGVVTAVSTIEQCYATGDVFGDIKVGGLIGYIVGDNELEDCYARGDVDGTEEVGGLIGCNKRQYGSTYENHCYSTGAVPESGSYIGGLIGQGPHWSSSTSYWDIESSGTGSSASGNGVTTVEMKAKATFVQGGWDFGDVWRINEGVDYPILQWQYSNTAPTANAGLAITAYAWINGLAEVHLDGTNSYDPDGDALTYLWAWEIDSNCYDANGVNPVIELPVGEHVITLVVNDGITDSEPNSCIITVLPAIETNMSMKPKNINSRKLPTEIDVLILIPAELVNDFDVNVPVMLEPVGSSAYEQSLVTRGPRTYVYACFSVDLATVIDPSMDSLDVTAAAELRSGQWLCATGSLRIH